MNLLNTLTIKSLKLNKKRTIVTIIGIILSVALITSVAGMYTSLIKSLISYETNQMGNYHVAYFNVPSEDIDNFKNNKVIDTINITKSLGYAKIDSKNEYKPYIFVMGFTSDALNNLAIRLVDGRLPINENEILIPTHLKTNGRVFYNVGDSITLKIGDRVVDDYALDQNNPYNEDEVIKNKKTKTYKIVGIIERPSRTIEPYSAPGYTLITYIDKIEGKVDIYTRYTKDGLKRKYEITANILEIDKNYLEYIDNYNGHNGRFADEKYDKAIEELSKAKYEIDINNYLVMLETNPIKENTIAGLGIVVVFVSIIIIVTSVFCIKNSFDISISEKIKEYGMLKSIGATKKQIKKNVLYEAFILGVISIPLGILAGNLATFILIKVSNYYLSSSFNFHLEYEISYLAILLGIILGSITIYLSAIRSANKASRISPIKLITNSSNIKYNKNKTKLFIIKKLFGIGGEVSYKNIKRNKKKYRTTVISIIVSVTVFISLSYIMNLLYEEIKSEISTEDYNISLIVSPKGDIELYNKAIETTKLDKIKTFTIKRTRLPHLNNPKCNPEYQKRSMDCPNGGFDTIPIFIISVGEKTYNEYINKLGLKYDDIKDKGILVDYYKMTNQDDKGNIISSEMIRKYTYNIGDKITFTGDINLMDSFDIEVGYVTDLLPFGISSKELNPHLIISDEYMDNYKYSNYGLDIYYDSENPDELQNEIEDILKDEVYTLSNTSENVRSIKNFYTLLAIFLYGFITVISLIGITNIINTITTSMELRKREFATLKSIGMTNYEFNRMIRLESLFLGLKSLLISIPLGTIITYIVYKSFVSSNTLSTIKYKIPFMSILICITVVFILIVSLMKYSINKIAKQNTIETIRNENI